VGLRLVCWLLLVAHVALSLGGRAAVLCFEADGAVVLEARGDICCDEEQAAPEAAPGVVLTARDADPVDCCIDVPLAQALSGERPRGHDAAAPPAPVTALQDLPFAPDVSGERLASAAASGPPGARADLDALRTVVIRV